MSTHNRPPGCNKKAPEALFHSGAFLSGTPSTEDRRPGTEDWRLSNAHSWHSCRRRNPNNSARSGSPAGRPSGRRIPIAAGRCDRCCISGTESARRRLSSGAGRRSGFCSPGRRIRITAWLPLKEGRFWRGILSEKKFLSRPSRQKYSTKLRGGQQVYQVEERCFIVIIVTNRYYIYHFFILSDRP